MGIAVLPTGQSKFRLLENSGSFLPKRLHAEKQNSTYGSEGHDKHADFIDKHFAVRGLGGMLVDHFEHGDLP